MYFWKDFMAYRKYFRNWKRVLINVKLHKFPIQVTTRSGNVYSVSDFVDLWVTCQTQSSSFPKLKLIRSNGWFGDVDAIYKREEYSYLKCKGEIVVDIGANIGDSALYFIIKGAKMVIAVEPFPANYKILLENIAQNNLFEKIIPINAMIGIENREVFLDVDRKITTGTDAKESENGSKIDMITLARIVSDYKITGGLLKIDCEGCEYNAILNTDNEILKKFKRIQIESHYGYERIVDKLKTASFFVTYSRPKNIINKSASYEQMRVSMIKAERNQNTELQFLGDKQ